VLLMRGVSGSGKSWLSQQLLETMGVFRIRSDKERKRLFAATAVSSGDLNSGLYAPELTEKTYQRLLDLTKTISAAGYGVIIDATFLRQQQIQPFVTSAEASGIPLTVITTTADRAVLEERLTKRAAEADNISDATTSVLTYQLENMEPVPAGIPHIEVDTGQPIDVGALIKQLS
jgi:predicted kinase